MIAAKHRSIPSLVSSWRKQTLRPAAKMVHRRARITPEAAFEWLKTALQSAINLEFATIPPYLCALWSIKDELHPVAKSIREIVQEEMLHMALTCNMLAAIGQQPRITDRANLPNYPGRLPGGVHPGLVVRLSGLSKRSLKTFLTIERPSEFPSNVELDDIDRQPVERTIGQFYDCIREAFHTCGRQLSTEHQISGPLAWMVIERLEHVDKAIGLIQRQGEGAKLGPQDSMKEDYAHYYRFKEIYLEKHLVYDARRKIYGWSGHFEWPEVWPMAAVKKGGYLEDEVPRDVWCLLERFDQTYTDLLNLLQMAWRRGGQASLLHAIDKMFELQRYAKPLMQIPVPAKTGASRAAAPRHYGPCFRYLPDRQIDPPTDQPK